MAEPKALSAEDVLALISENNKVLVEGFKEFAKELKKPNEFEQAKLDKEAALLRNKQRERLQLGAIQEQKKLMNMLSCPHQRPDGKTAWGAQTNTGTRCFVPMCVQCQSQLPPIPATVDQLQNGVNLNTYNPPITMEVLLVWHKKSYKNDCGNPDCVACHPEKLDAMREGLRQQYVKAQQQAQAVGA